MFMFTVVIFRKRKGSLHNVDTGYILSIFDANKVVFGENFHPNCFQVDLQAKLLGYTPSLLRHRLSDKLSSTSYWYILSRDVPRKLPVIARHSLY